MPPSNKFSRTIRKWRGESSQVEAALAIGVNVATYRNWEQGRYEPSNTAKPFIESKITKPMSLLFKKSKNVA